MSNLPVIPLSTWAKGKSDEEVSDFLKGFGFSRLFVRRSAKLLEYYTRNGFVAMHSQSDSGENDKLAQLFRFID